MKDFIETLLKLNLTPAMYAYLICISESREFPWKISNEARDNIITHLIDNGFIVKQGELYILKGKALNLLDIEPIEPVALNTCASWIEEWIDLWPKGVKSGSRPVRAGKQSIVTKMNTFLANHKDAKPQDIIDCTKAYIDDLESRQWAYITCADYFISKNRSSLLEALLDNFDRDNYEKYKSGESDFYKIL